VFVFGVHGDKRVFVCPENDLKILEKWKQLVFEKFQEQKLMESKVSYGNLQETNYIEFAIYKRDVIRLDCQNLKI